MSASTTPVEPTPPKYWTQTFEIYYQAYLQEMYAEYLSDFWSKWDRFSAILVAATATGSTVTGFALWKTASGQVVWGIIAGVAAVTSLITGGLQVAQAVKLQGDLRTKFLHVRLQLADFRQDMPQMAESDQKTRFETLRTDFNAVLEMAKSDFALTESRRKIINDKLDAILKAKGKIT
jgi:hypothetical protein